MESVLLFDMIISDPVDPDFFCLFSYYFRRFHDVDFSSRSLAKLLYKKSLGGSEERLSSLPRDYLASNDDMTSSRTFLSLTLSLV